MPGQGPAAVAEAEAEAAAAAEAKAEAEAPAPPEDGVEDDGGEGINQGLFELAEQALAAATAAELSAPAGPCPVSTARPSSSSSLSGGPGSLGVAPIVGADQIAVFDAVFAQCTRKGGVFDFKLFETKYNDEVVRRHPEAAARGHSCRLNRTLAQCVYTSLCCFYNFFCLSPSVLRVRVCGFLASQAFQGVHRDHH